MLEIVIPSRELWDEISQEFITTKEQTLRLEHSLVSISKWESIWCKPFLSTESKTDEETIDYIKCMTLTKNVDPEIYKYLTDINAKEINEYIESPMTATRFYEEGRQGTGFSKGVTTSEIIYNWMISLTIPIEFQKWHLNRLLTLIKVCNIKNGPQKKMSKREQNSRNASLNAARRKKLNTKG